MQPSRIDALARRLAQPLNRRAAAVALAAFAAGGRATAPPAAAVAGCGPGKITCGGACCDDDGTSYCADAAADKCCAIDPAYYGRSELCVFNGFETCNWPCDKLAGPGFVRGGDPVHPCLCTCPSGVVCDLDRYPWHQCCAAGETCQDGSCVAACAAPAAGRGRAAHAAAAPCCDVAAGEVACGNTCCVPPQTCQSGICARLCESPQLACGGTCVLPCPDGQLLNYTNCACVCETARCGDVCCPSTKLCAGGSNGVPGSCCDPGDLCGPVCASTLPPGQTCCARGADGFSVAKGDVCCPAPGGGGTGCKAGKQACRQGRCVPKKKKHHH